MMRPETYAKKLFQQLLRLRIPAEQDDNLVTVKTPGFVLHVVYHLAGMTAAYPYKIGNLGMAQVMRSIKWEKHTVVKIVRWVTSWYSKRNA